MKTYGRFLLGLVLVVGVALWWGFASAQIARPGTPAQIPPPSLVSLTGTVVAFASSTSVPDGWLLCDGSTVSSLAFPDLVAVIGEAHGDGGDGPGGNFDLPDYRGRFLRGVDGGTGRDPDAATREAMNSGGATGDNVGSIQGDATMDPNNPFFADTAGSHTHSVNSAAGHFHSINSVAGHTHSSAGSHNHGSAGSHTHTGSGNHGHGIGGNTHFHFFIPASGGTNFMLNSGTDLGDGNGFPRFATAGFNGTDNASHSHSISSTTSHDHGSSGNHSHSSPGNHSHGSAGGHSHSSQSAGDHGHTTNDAGSHTHPVMGGDAETRPINAYVHWIIKT